jgi:hypothetical protein
MGEQGVQKGTGPLKAPMLRISKADVLLPTLTTWGRPFRKSRIQLQREVLICWGGIQIVVGLGFLGLWC